jgi:hypothetical protein
MKAGTCGRQISKFDKRSVSFATTVLMPSDAHQPMVHEDYQPLPPMLSPDSKSFQGMAKSNPVSSCAKSLPFGWSTARLDQTPISSTKRSLKLGHVSMSTCPSVTTLTGS